MEILLYVLGAALLLAGAAGTVLPALPGAPLLAGGALLVAWAGDFQRLGAPSLVAVGVLSVLVVAVDWIAGVLGAKAFGATRWAVIGSMVGLVVGLFLGPAGILLGPVAGAIVFEWWKDPDLERAMRAGVGVGIGMLVGGAVKIALAVAILGIVVFALFV